MKSEATAAAESCGTWGLLASLHPLLCWPWWLQTPPHSTSKLSLNPMPIFFPTMTEGLLLFWPSLLPSISLFEDPVIVPGVGCGGEWLRDRLKYKGWGWRDGSAVSSTGYSGILESVSGRILLVSLILFWYTADDSLVNQKSRVEPVRFPPSPHPQCVHPDTLMMHLSLL